MKSLSITFLFAINCLNVFSQKAEKIYGGARQHKPISYYKEQAIAWKKEIDKNPKDPNNWYNYYYVNRNLTFHDTTDKRSSEEKHQFLLELIDEMEKNIPNTYEFNLCKWMVGGFNMKLLPYLKKAAELGEGRTEHLDFLINIGEAERIIKDRDYYSIKKYETGQFSSGIINYNYNVLMGLDKNAILLTEGDNDTYPVWLLQAQGIRKDVTVLNLNFIIWKNDYRDKIFGELGINKWKLTDEPDGKATEADYQKLKREIIKHIASNKNNYPVYTALTAACDEKYLSLIKQNLYLTGLAYLYSNEAVDNIGFLRKNIEKNYALDYLNVTFYQDLSPQMVKIINRNYVVPFLTLYDHYKLTGDIQKQEWIKSLLLKIAADTEDEEKVKKHLQ